MIIVLFPYNRLDTLILLYYYSDTSSSKAVNMLDRVNKSPASTVRINSAIEIIKRNTTFQ